MKFTGVEGTTSPQVPLYTTSPEGWIIAEGIVQRAERLDGVEIPDRYRLVDVRLLEGQDALHIFGEEVLVEAFLARVVSEPVTIGVETPPQCGTL